MNVELFGTHGTTISRAESLCRTGFEISAGRGGTGAYFWRNNSYATVLAKGWYDNATRRGDYSKDINKKYSCLSVRISLSEEFYLNLEDPEIRDHLALVLKMRGLGWESSKDREKLAQVFDMFISDLESDLGIEYEAWQIRIAAPNKVDYPYNALGHPICYIVKNKKRITIISRNDEE
ncbi:MAG: hypothetical protein PF518_10920 [Spirochaetaceae bacterium]|jgi:hypothetical protein|nr:hypothetical protein [Spirochaetaceae bacterium]